MPIDTFVPMLRTLSDLVEKGRAHGDALVPATLAPGMYGLGMQVLVACNHAVDSAARLAGREGPQREQRPETLDDVKALIAQTIEFLESLPKSAGSTERTIEMPLRDDLVMTMSGERFVRDWALPLFYFHVVLAYAILRHEGVEIGVEDYLTHIGDAIHTT